MNTGRSPQRIRYRHGSNQVADVVSDRGAAGLLAGCPRKLRPIPAEPTPMPTHYRIRMDDEQCPPPVLPTAGEDNPKPSVAVCQQWTCIRPLVDSKLLAQGKILQSDSGVAAKQQIEHSENRKDGCQQNR